MRKESDRSDDNNNIQMDVIHQNNRNGLGEQISVSDNKVRYLSLFGYIDKKGMAIFIVASLASAFSGACLPMMTLVYGEFAGSFATFSTDQSKFQLFNDQINQLATYFLYIGIGQFVLVYVGLLGYSYVSEAIARGLRLQYLRAIFRQDMAFFDTLGAGEVISRISSDMITIQEGTGQKASLFISGVSMFLSATIIAFSRSWKLTMIMMPPTLAIILVIIIFSRKMQVNQGKANQEFSIAATLAEEAVSSSRDVAAYGTQARLQTKYHEYITKATKWDLMSKVWLSLIITTTTVLVNLLYALAFWQGNHFLSTEDVSVADIMTVVMAVLVAGGSLSQNMPHLQAFSGASAAATRVVNTIRRNSPIDPDAGIGEKPEFLGGIEFRNVTHIYPSRPDNLVLRNFSLKITPGKTIALVGASGSGKSSIFSLLQRFYLPVSGDVYMDGRNITELDLRWLRRQMSIVDQDPTLFCTTIFQNIAYGLVGSDYENVAQDLKVKLIEEAARTANAYNFVMDLPEGFQTIVGEKGSRLSGGQKQRIAIARAVVSNPKILLLDEATAALDAQSEKIVQEALDKATKERTTITIAHRLSTIKDCDEIVVMAQGVIVEQGKHAELITARGTYQSLVETQELRSNPQLDNDSQQTAFVDVCETTKPQIATVSAEEKEKKDEATLTLLRFGWMLHHGQYTHLTVGFILSVLRGSNPAVQAVFLSNSITALVTVQNSMSGKTVSFWCWMFIMLGLVMGVFAFGQAYTLSKASSQLIIRVRESTFSSLLRQDAEFFESNSVTSSALSTLIASEANRLAGLSGATLGTILTSIATLVITFTVGTAFGWKLALVCTATIPLMLGCGYFQLYALSSMEKRRKMRNDALSFACEAASSIRTVISLSLDKHLLDQYQEKLIDHSKQERGSLCVSIALYAASQGIFMLIMGLVFWYGGRLMLHKEYTVLQFFVIYSAIVNGAQSAGAIFSFAPNMSEAKQAAVVLKSFHDRIPAIDHWSTEGQKPMLKGKIEIENVSFGYPSRPSLLVLKNIHLVAEPGQFIALVGASGSGKSTIVALLERFYNPTSGRITIDGIEIDKLNLQHYRSQLAIVSQEMTMYTGTIKENILANKEDANEELIIQACKDANIYDFICSLPEGFNTAVGAKGALLSGGQRQRLAIAKALLRNPRILLLDEATSALDSASERVVQTALNKASKGRTTIAIAHRLSTIQHADKIHVFGGGKIIESGRHEDLVKRRGAYWQLARIQDVGLSHDT